MLHARPAQGAEGPLIKQGDLVVVYERHDSLKAVTVSVTSDFNNRFGHFKMKDWIGRPFGSRVLAKSPSSGWVYLLRPNPEIWTKVLLHRTQILYAADISLICSFLELRPGAKVLECGTGSGSLTHALVRAVAPAGHVHTFEYHEQRATLAMQEFKDHGLEGMVTVAQRDIEQAGFPEELHGHADAAFLDVPGPWKAVASAGRCLRPNGMLATFSPCIEQVHRTRGALAAENFWDVRMFECLLRDYEVRSESMVADLDAHATSSFTGAGPRKRKHGAEAPSNGQVPDGVLQTHTLARPVAEGRGHTGYLVFARRAVSPASGLASENAGDLSLRQEAVVAPADGQQEC